MTTTKTRTGHALLVDQMRGVPADREAEERKILALYDILSVAGDYSIGDDLIEHAHARIDEALALLGAALAPYEGHADFSNWQPAYVICDPDRYDHNQGDTE